MAEDFYKTLGVSRDASSADIQKAYRDLARKYHPDLHPDDKTAKKKFQKVQAAFDVLNDAAKREQYDRYGSSFESMGAGGPRGASGGGGWGGAAPGGSAGFEDVDFSQFFGDRSGGEAPASFSDLFSQFRRGQPGRTKRAAEPQQGADLAAEIEVPFNTAILGGEAQISIRRQSGEVETLVVKIPVGIEDGKKIRLRGQGEAPPTARGTPGDILITVRVASHPHFSRRGKNLDVQVPVTLSEAVSGAKIEVPTPQGTIMLRVPPGTSSGKKLRVKGRGVAPKGSEPGDLFAEIQIVLPAHLDDESRELVAKLDAHWQEKSPQHPRRDLSW
jgi:molecular chaperone DnaJ/curved DNA-binding protein